MPTYASCFLDRPRRVGRTSADDAYQGENTSPVVYTDRYITGDVYNIADSEYQMLKSPRTNMPSSVQVLQISSIVKAS